VNTRASFNGTSAAGIFSALPGVQADGDSSGVSVQGALPYQVDVTIDGITVKKLNGRHIYSRRIPIDRVDLRDSRRRRAGQCGVRRPRSDCRDHQGRLQQTARLGFWYYQDNKWNAIPYTYPTPTTKPLAHGATFGGSVGGPVVIPHLYDGHNKSFFFGVYEGWRFPNQQTLQEVVPSTG
jgi:hypothetical protein